MYMLLWYFLVFLMLWWLAHFHTLEYVQLISSAGGRLFILCLIMAVTVENKFVGLFLSILFIVSDVIYVIKPTPNLIAANSSTFAGNFLDDNRMILDQRIKYENYVFVKPINYPLVKQQPMNNRILPYGS